MESVALPRITIADVEYFVDCRLWELRDVNNPHNVRVMTCKKCSDREFCALAGDPYNLDGACLMAK